jgi:hypothetical protein
MVIICFAAIGVHRLILIVGHVAVKETALGG